MEYSGLNRNGAHWRIDLNACSQGKGNIRRYGLVVAVPLLEELRHWRGALRF